MKTYHSFTHLMLILSMSMFFTSMTLNASNTSIMLEWTLFDINSASVSAPIMLDSMSTLFMSTVTFISFNVLTFSKTYMHSDINLSRFTHTLTLFITSMLLLILFPNVITMMLGWDGLGLTSFLLVIYYNNKSSLKSGMITALTNRIGDALLLIAIGLIMSQGHWDMMNMWKEAMNNSSITSIMILLAAMTKSAQFPFVAWLPEAMAAPTPVSALVHSSTLVTAGVYILIRLYPFLSQTSMFNTILLTSGLMTSWCGAWWSTGYQDMKKAVALSTLSQLGLMMVSLSLNMVSFCFIHLLTHAMFKATLFMAVGVHIIMKHHNQKKKNIHMISFMPTVAAAASLSLLSMNAFFFMAGYYSKEIILETSIYNPWFLMIFVIMGMSTTMTVLYSIPIFRVLVISPITQKQYAYESHNLPKEWYMSGTNKTLIIPMTLMSLGTMCMGSLTFWMFITPAEIPILPYEQHFSPFFWAFMGVYTAISSCRLTTKFSSPLNVQSELWKRSTHKSLLTDTMFHNKKTNHLSPFMKGFSYLKILKTYMLHSRRNNSCPPTKPDCLPSCSQYFVFETLQVKHASPFSIRWNAECLEGWLFMSYSLASPIMNISLSTLKTLDQGITTLMSAEGIKTMLPQTSKMILSHQSNHITKLILLFMVMVLMFAPLIF